MLRPERMSRVSVTGSKRVMDDVVETVHDLGLLHVSEYDGSWDYFEPGDPVEGAETASEKLVTVRSLKSILDVDEDDAGPTRLVTDEALDEELEEIRQQVNELDDRRDEHRNDLRSVEDKIQAVDPFVTLGIDLDLLQGYDHLAVVVGEGDPESVRGELARSDVDTYQLFTEDDVVAVFARTDEETLQDALVGATFTDLAVPDGDEDPESYREELQHRKQQLESKLSTVENELEELRLDVAGFLLAAEEKLAIDVQKREAPLTFATTDHAFVAEGWLPSDRYADLVEALTDAVGEAIEVDELERADYSDEGHPESTEEVESDDTGGSGGASATETVEASADEESESQEVAADGGIVTMGDSRPPVIQDNPGVVKPFEALVEIINRPQYDELDPTLVFFLTFPAFFGFMIGDLGYGILYMGLGYWLMKSFDNDIVKSLGGVGLLSGLFTAIFGVLYGELFGLHQLGYVVWGTAESAGVVGQLFGMHGPPIHKGLQPHYLAYAQAWLLVSVIAGVLHLVVGRLFDFYNNLDHGIGEAFMESGSWIIFTVGVWLWVFTRTAMGPKPSFMFEVFGSGEGAALPLGFTGFPVVELFRIPLGGFDLVVGVALAMTIVGLLLVVAAEGGIGLVESITQGFGHVVSYTRIAAVLLAKAGMALAVNLLVFGATLHGGEFHLIWFMSEEAAADEVVFQGLLNFDGGMAIVGLLFGIVLLVLGHLLVLVLGITSAGLQAVRLEYVEFFGKFFEGGGKAYDPFGYDREFTTED